MSMRGFGSMIDIHLPSGYRGNDGAARRYIDHDERKARVPARPIRAERDAAVGKSSALGKATMT